MVGCGCGRNNNIAQPVQNKTVPVQNKTVPVVKPVQPVQNRVFPVVKPVQSVQNKVIPVVKPVQPVQNKVIPVVKPVQPVQNKVIPAPSGVSYDRHIIYSQLPPEYLRSWDKLHKKSVEANTTELKLEFERYIEFLSHNFPCPKCRPHIKTYLTTHPIQGYHSVEDGLAKWSWEFHNDVNRRLHKPVFTWDAFKQKYLN